MITSKGPDHSFVLHETFAHEVKAVINRLLRCKSVRMNDIPLHILKLRKNALPPFLAQMFNLCITEGTYPKRLNCAQVILFTKWGKRSLH